MTGTALHAKRQVFLYGRFPSDVVEGFAARYDVRQNPGDRVMSERELAEAAQGCQYLVVSPTENVTRYVLQTLSKSLQAVATMSVGYDHVDLVAARELGVAVFYSPGVLSDACAEIAMLLLLGAARRATEAAALVKSGEWGGYAPTQLLGIGLNGRRAGIVGMGRIGQAAAHRLRAFGVAIHYHNRRRLPAGQELGATYHETAESLLMKSDFLVLTAPGGGEMRGFLNRERLDLLPQRAIVVNISRGDTVIDDVLIEALQRGRIFAAGLDVFANEPKVDPRYFTLPNVVLTPHIGSATVDTRNAMGFLLLDGLDAFEHGMKSENQLC